MKPAEEKSVALNRGFGKFGFYYFLKLLCFDVLCFLFMATEEFLKGVPVLEYPWLDSYCLSKKGVVRDYKEEWQAMRYQVAGKMMAMIGADKKGKPILTVKLEPSFGLHLREMYPDIVPGYYMNKEHWNSLNLEGSVPEEVVRDMVDKAYSATISCLTKKAREEL